MKIQFDATGVVQILCAILVLQMWMNVDAGGNNNINQKHSPSNGRVIDRTIDRDTKTAINTIRRLEANRFGA
jgi:hypothetical protein